MNSFQTDSCTFLMGDYTVAQNFHFTSTFPGTKSDIFNQKNVVLKQTNFTSGLTNLFFLIINICVYIIFFQFRWAGPGAIVSSN